MFHALVRWDSNHYVSLVDNGYTKQQSAFFPLYPSIVGLVGKTVGISTEAALFAVSWLFAFLAIFVIYKWLRFELHERKIKLSPWVPIGLIAIFPTSFYLVAGYSESLFLFLTVSSLFAYRTKHYVLAGIFAAFATATRVQGGTLAIFFLVDYLLQKKWSDWKKLIPIVMTPIGLVVYAIYLNATFGNPLEFIAAQTSWGRLSGDIISNLISSFTPPYFWYLPVLGIGLWAIYKYLGKSWFIYSLVFILIPITSGRLDSLNRYLIVLAPLFLALAIYGQKAPQLVKHLFIVSSVFLLAWNIILFCNNYWVG